MAKKRTLNEIRQEKNYGYTAPILSDQGGTYNVPYKGADAVPSKGFIEDQEAAKQMAEIDRQECPLDPVEEAKILIVNKLTQDLHDIFFEHVCEEMSNHAAFQSQTYLTEEGYELFEDEWFEFYHEHHGDILHEVTQNITN